MSLLEIFTPVLSQLSGYVDTDPSGVQFLAQSTVSASYIISAITSQRKISALETQIRYNFQLIDMKISQKIDYDYIKSDAFMANFVQAIRATETAESNEKIKIIAQALAGCTLKTSDSPINKALCMRIIDQITIDEIDYLTSIMLDDRWQRNPDSFRNFGAFIMTNENEGLVLGLSQLGLLKLAGFTGDHERRSTWRPTVLGEHLMLLKEDYSEG